MPIDCFFFAVQSDLLTFELPIASGGDCGGGSVGSGDAFNGEVIAWGD